MPSEEVCLGRQRARYIEKSESESLVLYFRFDEMIEIERKFLVNSNKFREESFRSELLVQAYLNSDPRRAVRVRIKGDQGFLTIKGKSDESGRSRFEWEKEIPQQDAEDLLQLCEPGEIRKTRFLVKAGNKTIEVDEFFDANEGLIIAEIELTSIEETFEKPEWLGEEVTGDKRYYNSYLSKKPFNTW